MSPDAVLTRLARLPAARLWLRPLALLSGPDAAAAIAAARAHPLAGDALAFGAAEVLALGEGGYLAAALPLPALRGWAEAAGRAVADRIAELLAALAAPRAVWAGLPLDRPRIMGVVNVTPDSFSDGGDFADPARAIAAGRAMLAAGADIIDVGGESTRPGAAPITPEEERRRVEPVVEALAAAGALVSIDTRHASVMAAALARGARIVNDVTALTGDPAARATAAKAGAAVVLMHMQGEPRTMQRDPSYVSAPIEVTEYLAARIADCLAAGIARDRIVVDPGIGFGKTLEHNLDILARLALLHGLGCGVLLGASRKSFIGGVTGAAVPKERLPGSLAAALYGVAQGVHILRVHDVAETRQALAVWRGIAETRR